MTQSINQFSQAPEKGSIDLQTQPNTVSCQVDTNEAVALVPGQAVIIDDVAGGAPIVTLATADTSEVFGFVMADFKDASFAAGAPVEIAADYNVLYLESGAAIARGARVQYVVTGEKVITAVTAKTVVGIAMDKAAADGDLIRVMVKVVLVAL